MGLARCTGSAGAELVGTSVVVSMPRGSDSGDGARFRLAVAADISNNVDNIGDDGNDSNGGDGSRQ